MTRRFFSGSTLDQAVMLAARHYGVDPEELAYRQIEKKHGFLRTRKAVMIAVDPEDPRRGAESDSATPEPTRVDPAPPPVAEAAPEPAPAPPAEPAQEPPTELTDAATDESEQVVRIVEAHEPESAEPEDEERQPDDELLAAAERATATLLGFAGIDAQGTASTGAERIEVEVEGPDGSLLVVEGGKGLLAIQHLLPRMLRGLTGRSSFVRVDSQGFHQQRKQRLEALAHKEAEAASRDGNPRTLPSMAPDERRIVHMALKDSPAVVTESRGTGLHKRVVIRPADGDGGRNDIEARHGF